MSKLVSLNPAINYQVIGGVTTSSEKEIRGKVALARRSKKGWEELGIKKRIEIIRSVAKEFSERNEEIAILITQETGKLLREAREEIQDFEEELEWLLKNAPVVLGEEVTHEDKNSLHKIVYEPHGAAAVITPWNFPFGMAMWGLIPNLLAGNTVVFKISEECPLVGKLIEEVMNRHLPTGVFSEVYGGGRIGEFLCNSEIDFLWFTGSTKVGQKLYKVASKKFIPVLLEMGGSNPCIVFDDIDVESAAVLIYRKRFSNAGQSCDAIKRLIVHENIFETMMVELKKLAEVKKIGDPLEEKMDMGSLISKKQLILLKEQVKDALKKGAKIVTGGRQPERVKGAFFPPTILTNITKDMRVWKEEVFGPVLPLITFKTEDEAINLGNDTIYGLGAKVFSKDMNRAQRVASKIKAGNVEINAASHWLPCNPFGGYKKSGMGREHGIMGLRGLCQTKVISTQKE